MLLADASGRRIASTLRGAATWPYLLDSNRRSFEQAQSFLYGFRRDWTGLQAALHTELQRSGWSDPFFSRGEAYRMEEAARRIAAGAIQTGQMLRPDIEIRFLEQFPYASVGDWVIFPRPDLVKDFLAGASNAEQVGRLAHKAMRHRPLRGSRHHRSGHSLADAAMLLAIDELRLIPFDRNGTVYLLGLSHSDLGSADVAGGGDAATPPAGADPPATAKGGAGKGHGKGKAGADPGPRSVLPAAPDSPSPQAQALQDAANAGTPFCEECAAAALQAPPREPDAAIAPPSPASADPVASASASRSAAPAGAALRRPLPTPPATPSPQAQAMQDAAANGTPFCEECAAAAAEMSHA